MFALLLMLLISALNSQAQNKIPTRAAFKESTVRLQTEIRNWQHAADTLRVDELPVSYASGKVIDQDLSILKADLGLASRLATRVLDSERLSDAIALMVEVADVGRQFDEISNLLLYIDTPDKATAATIRGLAKSFSDISGGQLNEFYLSAYGFVTVRADEIENKNCSGDRSR